MLIEIHEMVREVETCDAQPFDLRLASDGSVHLQPKGQTAQLPMPRAGQVVSLQFLRHLSLTKEQRFSFFCDYINGTYRTDMCPVNLILLNGRLRYHMLTHELPAPTTPTALLAPGAADRRADPTSPAPRGSFDDVDAIMRTLGRELQLPFSFLQWGSRAGNLSMAVAEKWPNATVLSFEPNNEKAAGHFAETRRRRLDNNLVGVVGLRESEVNKFLHSPEFLRYAYVGWEQLLRMINARGADMANGLRSDELSRTLGTLFATAVSTLVQVRGVVLPSQPGRQTWRFCLCVLACLCRLIPCIRSHFPTRCRREGCSPWPL
jgi:hypothetical protein